MAKTQAPLFGFGAGGQLGKAFVYGTWRGVPYARQYVSPANPQSAAQTKTRSIFAWASNTWKEMPSLGQDPWNAFASGRPLTGRNAWIGKATKNLRSGTDTSAVLLSPGAAGGLPPLTISATVSGTTITVGTTNPTAPAGWTLTSMIAALISNQDPHSSDDYTYVAGEDASTQDSVALTAPGAGSWTVGAWLKWTKPNGTFAYSSSSITSATTT